MPALRKAPPKKPPPKKPPPKKPPPKKPPLRAVPRARPRRNEGRRNRPLVPLKDGRCLQHCWHALVRPAAGGATRCASSEQGPLRDDRAPRPRYGPVNDTRRDWSW